MQRYQRQLQALGSVVLLTIVTEKDEHNAEKILTNLVEHVTEFEQRFSRFLSDSELTEFNNNAGSKIPITLAFRKLLSASKELSLATQGLYNPFILPALQSMGYVNSWTKPNVNVPNTNYEKRHVVSVETLVVGDSWAKIPKDTALDFGGIGKGYLLDELSNYLEEESLIGYWLSLGGDIICAGHDLNNHSWSVGIQHVSEPTKSVGEIKNENGNILAIATSGTTKRKGTRNGKAWHHIIDPRTGQPAETNILTATVTASKAVVADVYAKCIVIAGTAQAKIYEGDRLIDAFLLQLNDNQSTIIRSNI